MRRRAKDRRHAERAAGAAGCASGESGTPHHDDAPLHVITTAGLRWLAGRLGERVDPRRFRPSVVVDAAGDECVDDNWGGRCGALGAVTVQLGPAMPRCVMADAAQPGLARHGGILKALAARDVTFGLMAAVESRGTIAVGDTVRLL